MEAINGVAFEDWAAACANVANGMDSSRVCEILGLEAPVWEETNDKWMMELGRIMTEDIEAATFYGSVFSNPKIGKFADVADAAGGQDEALAKVSDYETYKKIFWHIAIAEQNGIDSQNFIQGEYGISILEWTQASEYWMGTYRDKLSIEHQTTEEYVNDAPLNEEQKQAALWGQLDDELDAKYKPHFEDIYATADVADDIDF